MTQAELESCALSQNAAQQEETAAEAISRRLTALQSEIRRYQTRLFAYERAMLALRRENEQLQEHCEEMRVRLSEWMDVPAASGETAPVLENIPDDAFCDTEPLVRPQDIPAEADETSVPAETEPFAPVLEKEGPPAEAAPVEPEEVLAEAPPLASVPDEVPAPAETPTEAAPLPKEETAPPQTDLERRAAALLAQFDQIQKYGL